MKRLIAAGILMLIVIASYILSRNYIINTCDEIKSLVIECETEYKQNSTSAEKTAEKLEKTWSEKEQILSFFVNHDRVDEIELALSSLNVYSNKFNNDIFYEYSGEIKMLLHQLEEDSKISAHSVF